MELVFELVLEVDFKCKFQSWTSVNQQNFEHMLFSLNFTRMRRDKIFRISITRMKRTQKLSSEEGEQQSEVTVSLQ